MTAVVLTGFVGAGTVRDPFRADITHNGNRQALYDLRPDQSLVTGWCVVVIEGESEWFTSGTSMNLTDSLNNPIPGGIRAQVGEVLGVTIPAGTRIGEALAMRSDFSQVAPGPNGKRRIQCNGIVLHEDP